MSSFLLFRHFRDTDKMFSEQRLTVSSQQGVSSHSSAVTAPWGLCAHPLPACPGSYNDTPISHRDLELIPGLEVGGGEEMNSAILCQLCAN
jgi:hypothetical protein